MLNQVPSAEQYKSQNSKLKISFIKKDPPFPEDLSLIPVSAGSSVYYDCLYSDLFTVMVTYFDHEITA